MENIVKKNLFAVIDAVVKKTMTMDLTWEWPCGVAYYGICQAWEFTKNQEYLDFNKLDKGVPKTWIAGMECQYLRDGAYDVNALPADRGGILL